jgi:hypothetical protein
VRNAGAKGRKKNTIKSNKQQHQHQQQQPKSSRTTTTTTFKGKTRQDGSSSSVPERRLCRRTGSCSSAHVCLGDVGDVGASRDTGGGGGRADKTGEAFDSKQKKKKRGDFFGTHLKFAASGAAGAPSTAKRKDQKVVVSL